MLAINHILTECWPFKYKTISYFLLVYLFIIVFKFRYLPYIDYNIDIYHRIIDSNNLTRYLDLNHEFYFMVMYPWNRIIYFKINPYYTIIYQLGFQKDQVYLSCSKNGYIRLVTCSYIIMCLMTFKLMINLYTSVVKNNNMSRDLTYL